MTKRKQPAPKATSDANDHRAGYGRPPTRHQFKPGHSGNPKGRPKGRKNNATLLREILDRKIKIPVAGRIRSLSVREVMLTRFAEAALKGDIKSASYLLQRDDIFKSSREHEVEDKLGDDDRTIIEAYVKTRLQQGGES